MLLSHDGTSVAPTITWGGGSGCNVLASAGTYTRQTYDNRNIEFDKAIMKGGLQGGNQDMGWNSETYQKGPPLEEEPLTGNRAILYKDCPMTLQNLHYTRLRLHACNLWLPKPRCVTQ